jgi:tetratricopeptide (TPR) repeat protein
MKKLSILAMCLATAACGFAQTALVKEAERAVKGTTPNHVKIRATIKPALTNAESAGEAITWYVAGKNEFANYDDLFGKRALGQTVDGADMGHSLLDGYNYYMTALPLDTIVDEKGKVKTKYSKDIVKSIVGHYNDFDNAARFLWEAKDYKGAYNAWEIFLNMPTNAQLGKDAPKAPHDTIQAELMYNQGLAAWQADDLELALNSLCKAKEHGYTKKFVYDYAISMAAQLHRNDTVYALAAEALPLYGKEDPKFIGLVINGYIEKKQYSEAQSMIETALSEDPNNAQLYDVLGILYESQITDGMDKTQSAELEQKAMDSYKKAIEVDPSFARAQYDYGRKVADKAFNINDSATNLSQAEYIKVRDTQIYPLFREAATYFEKAYELNADEMSDALRYLRNLYYNLGDEDNLKRIESLQ